MGLREWWAETGKPHERPAVKATAQPTLARRGALTPLDARRQVGQQIARQRGDRSSSLRVTDDLQQAMKSLSYSDYVNDFINNTGFYEGDHYTAQQVEAAYRTSVYLFAAMRRVANLFSEVRLVGEVRKPDGSWQRLPPSHHLNMIFATAGARFMREAFLFYAMYGKTLIYKRKTRAAQAAYRQGRLISTYADGGIAGIHIIPNTKWDIDEDRYMDKINGFRLNEPDAVLHETGLRNRDEFVYVHDFDFRNPNDAVSMVSLALNNAITNAAVARWASHYFMSGAMPLLLVNIDESSPTVATEADLLRYKSAIERIWQGLWSKFTLRAFFTDRKLNVQQAGIKAQEVMAPELNQDALNAIVSVFQIAPDLIVPPPGGTQERHKWLIMDAYNTAILPVAWQFADQINLDFGFDEHSPLRLVVNEEDIRALEAERADVADTEKGLFESGGQTYGEYQERMKVHQRVPQLAKWVNVGGKFQSVERLMRDDNSPAEHIIQYTAQAFVDNALKRSEFRKLMFNLDTKPEEDGWYWQLVPQPGSTAPPGNAPDLPPGEPPPDGGSPPAAPKPPHGGTPPPHAASPGSPKPQGTPKPSPHGIPGAPKAPAAASGGGEKAEDEYDFDTRPEERFGAAVPAEASEGVPLAVTPVATAETQNEPNTAPRPVYTALWLGDDPLIAGVADQLRQALGTTPAKWLPPEERHITLVYGENATPEQVRALLTLLPEQCPAFHLRVTDLITFDTPEGLCVALAVELDNELAAFQRAICTHMAGQNIPISPFSQEYKAHITLCHLPSEADAPQFTCNLVVEPQYLLLEYEDQAMRVERGSIARWRELVDADEPDGTDSYSADPNTHEARERLYADLLRQRSLIRSALTAWQTTGEPVPGLRDQVQMAVRQALAVCGDDPAKAWLAIFLACERGQLDEQSDLEETPILISAQRGDADSELKAWENYELRTKSAGRPFVTHWLPEAVVNEVKAGLAQSTTQKARRQVFSSARATLVATTAAPMQTNEETLAGLAEVLGKNDKLSDLLS